MAFWSSKNGFLKFYCNDVLLLTYVNFINKDMKLEIQKRLGMFSTLRNRSAQYLLGKCEKIGFFCQNFIFVFGKLNILLLRLTNSSSFTWELFCEGCQFFESFPRPLKLLECRYGHPWKHIRAREQLKKPITTYSTKRVSYGQIP